MIWSVILASVTVSYFLISISLIIGVSKLKKNTLRSNDTPYVSILVPAKNEEKNIMNCLESLVHQQYPPDKYEIIVVNDRSSDNTPNIIESYQKKYNIIKCVNIDHNTSGLTGKHNALSEGLKHCSGEIIMNTDADCIAMPSWVRATVSYFTQQIGLTIGLSTAYNPNKQTLFTNLQSLDMLFLLDAAAGSFGMNVYISGCGQNLAYRKAILGNEGYFKLGYTITEDTALVQLVAYKTNWDITVVYDKDATITTSAETSLKRFLSQRIRWLLGGHATKTWSLIPLYSVFLFHICLVASFPLMFFMRQIIPVVLLSILIKMALDFIRCWRMCRWFDRLDLLRVFVPYEGFIIFYSIVIGLKSILVRKIQWKGDKYIKKQVL